MTVNDTLLTFFKALADANRLKIVGLLAHRPHTVEELAMVLGIKPPTISHHLSTLRGAGLVSADVQGHYHMYELNLKMLEDRAKLLEQPQALAQTEGTVDSYERKVLATFLDSDGRLKSQPAKRKKFQAILRHALRTWFSDSGPWTEAEVSQRLEELTDDVASVRRGFIDHAYMTRNPGGSEYRMTERGRNLDW